MMNQLFATDESTNAGQITYWRLDGTVDAARLRSAWEEQGLDVNLLVETPTPTTALARAMRECGERRRLVRKLEGTAGHAVVREQAHGDELDYEVELRVKLNAAGQPVCEPKAHPLAATVKTAFWRHLDELQPTDVGGWLCDLVRRVDGIALRDTGGIYYIPPSRVADWNRMAAALREASAHKVFTVPAMRSTDAVAAICDAIEQEARREAEAFENDIINTKLRGQALRNRATRCEQVEAKVQRYEQLLGTKLEALRDKLDHLRADLTAAALTKDNEDEEAT